MYTEKGIFFLHFNIFIKKQRGRDMNKEIGIVVIVIICLLVLCIGLLKKKAQFLLAFLVRLIVGVIAIIFTNKFFASQEMDLMVGVNPFSVLTIGVLGAGGFLLLYGIMAYRLL